MNVGQFNKLSLRAFICTLNLLVCAASLSSQASAQSAQQAPANAEPAAYEDKLINEGKLAPDDGELGGISNYNADGPPRLLRLEAQLGRTKLNEASTSVRGFNLFGQIDTAQYGGISLDAIFRQSPAFSHILTLRQLGLPAFNGWKANNTLGVFNTSGTELQRKQPRFVLPSNLIEGVGTEWINEAQGLQIAASMGEPSAFEGAQLPRLKTLGGRITQVSAQLDTRPWQFALAAAKATGISTGIPANLLFDPAVNNTQSADQSNLFASVRHQFSPDTSLQLNALTSAQQAKPSRRGFWGDAQTSSGPHRHSIGVFQFDPDLAWAGTPITSGLSGAYYRYGFSNRRWNIDAGLETLHLENSSLGNGWFGNLSGRYQFSRDTSLGSGVALRKLNQTAWSLFTFGETSTSWGQSRVQLDIARESDSRNTQISVDQLWASAAGTRLSTNASLARQTVQSLSSQSASLGIVGGVELLSNLSIDANLRTQRTLSGTVNNSTNASIGLSWRINSQWSLLGNYYENRGTSQLFPVLDPLAQPTSLTLTNNEQSFNLVLRFEERGGTATIPLGGRAGDASGRITGTVFLDANENGRRDANENAAANITLVLDERFAVKTDKDGRYSFPLVSTGSHMIKVSSEDLPLPWSVNNTSQSINVRVRDTVSVDFSATRIK
jgi:hypothetical protein